MAPNPRLSESSSCSLRLGFLGLAGFLDSVARAGAGCGKLARSGVSSSSSGDECGDEGRPRRMLKSDGVAPPESAVFANCPCRNKCRTGSLQAPHRLRRLRCSQMLRPPHSRQIYLGRLCLHRLPPPHCGQRVLRRPCSHFALPTIVGATVEFCVLNHTFGLNLTTLD